MEFIRTRLKQLIQKMKQNKVALTITIIVVGILILWSTYVNT